MTPKAESEANMESLIAQLREMLAPALQESFPGVDLSVNFLKRWIRAMDYKLNHAVRAIIKNLKWRSENNVDGILNEIITDVFCPASHRVIAHDFDGRPVILVEPTEELFKYSEKQLKKMAKAGLKNDRMRLRRFAIFQAETLESFVADSPTSDCRIIVDAKGRDVEISTYMKYIRKILPLALEVKEVAEEHYPGIVHSLYIINGPKKSLKVLLGLVSSAMSKEEKERLHIFGRKMEKWSKALLEIIPENDLSCDLGGTKIESFPTTCSG